MDTQRSGEIPHCPGKYKEYGPGGSEVQNPREITIEPGDTKLPPTQESGNTWYKIQEPEITWHRIQGYSN